MNRLFFCVIAAGVFFSALSVQGQQLTRAEIVALADKSRANLTNIPSYVTKRTEQTLYDGVTPNFSLEDEIEYIREPNSPMVVRSHVTTIITQNGSAKRYESIRIGKVEYRRSDKEDWAIAKPPPPPEPKPVPVADAAPAPTPTGKIAPPTPVIESFVDFLGDETLNGIPAIKYKITDVRTYPTRGSYSNSAISYYWFDAKKRLLKFQIDECSSVSPSISRLIDEYKYDTVIKIEAPIK